MVAFNRICVHNILDFLQLYGDSTLMIKLSLLTAMTNTLDQFTMAIVSVCSLCQLLTWIMSISLTSMPETERHYICSGLALKVSNPLSSGIKHRNLISQLLKHQQLEVVLIFTESTWTNHHLWVLFVSWTAIQVQQSCSVPEECWTCRQFHQKRAVLKKREVHPCTSVSSLLSVQFCPSFPASLITLPITFPSSSHWCTIYNWHQKKIISSYIQSQWI